MALNINNGQPQDPLLEQQQVEEVKIEQPDVVMQRQPTSLLSRVLGTTRKEAVNHPDHYGGKENPYEVIKVIRAWGLSFSLGNTVKYIARAGKKDPSKRIEDLHKAMWYLQEEINNEYEKNSK